MTTSGLYIEENRRKTPVVGEYDVAVIGGGIAGVAASVAAAREGVSVCLIEKENALGGLATLGLVVIYLPLCDGRGHQVIAGLGEELLKLSLRYGPGELPSCWADRKDMEKRKRQRYRVTFNPASFILSIEEFILKNGVELMYDSRFCDIHMDASDRIDTVIIENKSGRCSVRCTVAIDASGDADVAYKAGEKTVSLNTNRRSAWFFSYDGKDKRLHPLHDPLYSDLPEGAETFAGDNWMDVTRMNIESRRMILHKLKEDDSLEKGLYPLMLPSIPQLRMTRRLRSKFELDEGDSFKPFPDTVGLTGDWRRAGPVFAVPYRCLFGTRVSNLLTAGRCISVTNAMWDIARAIPACAVSGQGAGVASAVAVQKGISVGDIESAELQKKLRKQGVILDIP